MEISFFLAKIIGIYFVIMGVLALMMQKDLINLISKIREKHNFLVWGFVMTLIGLLIVVSHNIWTTSYQIAISLVGWVIFVKGLLSLFMPAKFFDDLIDSVNKPNIYNLFGVFAIFVGLWLAYFGFVL